MDKKNKQILIGLGLVLIGVLIGWAFTSRSYGEGPLAGIQSMSSSANQQCPNGQVEEIQDIRYRPDGSSTVIIRCVRGNVKGGIGGSVNIP